MGLIGSDNLDFAAVLSVGDNLTSAAFGEAVAHADLGLARKISMVARGRPSFGRVPF